MFQDVYHITVFHPLTLTEVPVQVSLRGKSAGLSLGEGRMHQEEPRILIHSYQFSELGYAPFLKYIFSEVKMALKKIGFDKKQIFI